LDYSLAILGALAIGLSLGLLGSGGSILTVPVLVYLVHHPEKQAIAESLAIVGGIALAGALMNIIKKQVDWKSVLFFSPPSMIGAMVGSLLSQPVSGRVLLGVFSLIMLVAAYLMLFGPDLRLPHPRAPRAVWKISADGFVVGCLIGFVGVGGGFMIVPALVMLGGLPMRLAVGTTLVIVTLSSSVSFAMHFEELHGTNDAVDWGTIKLFLPIGIAGSLVGHFIGEHANHTLLRRGFGLFLAIMGVAIFILQVWPRK
jgi:uncharacterized membrane protein YfcA